MKKIVCFGDSITARKEGSPEPMLTTMLSNLLAHYEIINAGVPGDNTINALQRLEKDVLSHGPDLVIVLFGANDAAFHKMVDLEIYKKNLLDIVSSIGPKKTLLLSAAPVDEDLQHARSNEVLRGYAEVVEQVSLETNSQYLDFYNHLLSMENYQLILKGEQNDGLHFGKRGYEILSGLIWEKVKSINTKSSYYNL